MKKKRGADSESAAGIDVPPGNTKPKLSAMDVMVEAVPMVIQWPYDRAIPSSTSFQSSCVMFPARSSSQYFQLSAPLPKDTPFQLPRSMGPAGKKITGTSMEMAPMSNPGVVLSHPPMSTAPSMGWERINSSHSMASMFR